MLDHISIPASNFDTSADFYDTVLATLGYERRKQRPGSIGYGPPSRAAPVFWIHAQQPIESAAPGSGLHISFQAPDRISVDKFHALAISHGGANAGPPGERPQYTQPFYGAFVYDPDGFKIEAVYRG